MRCQLLICAVLIAAIADVSAESNDNETTEMTVGSLLLTLQSDLAQQVQELAAIKSQNAALSAQLNATTQELEQMKMNLTTEKIGDYVAGYTSAIIFLQQNGRAEIAKMIRDNEGDLNAAEVNRKTSLHLASEKGHVDAVKLLLDRGVNIEARDAGSWNFTALLFASWQGRVDVVNVLISRGAQLEAINKDGWTSLHEASYNNHFDVVKVLIDRGAQRDPRAYGEGFTPLHYCCYYGKLDMVKVLVEKGVDINAKSSESPGRTPLKVATDQRQSEIAEYLRSRGGTN